MQMYWHKDDIDYIEQYRPTMRLRNHEGTKFKMVVFWAQNYLRTTLVILENVLNRV